MKTVKVKNEIKLMLVTLFMIIVGIGIVDLCFGNDTMASTTVCAECGASMTGNGWYTAAGGHAKKYICSDGCGYTAQESTSSHSYTSWANAGGGQHSKYCTVCMYSVSQSHTGGSHPNGNCSVCGTKYQTHSETGDGWYQDATQHGKKFKCTNAKCDYTRAESLENHTFGSWADNGDGRHIRYCTICMYQEYEEHRGYAHVEDGKCLDCGFQLCFHEPTEKYIPNKDGTHRMCLHCDVCGYWGDDIIDDEKCYDNEGNDAGECEKCGYSYHHNHVLSKVYWHNKASDTHSVEMQCEYCEYYEIVVEEEKCSGKDYENGGKCEKCGGTDDSHKHQLSIYYGTNKDGTHSVEESCSTCSYTNCINNAEKCSGGKHENSGACEKCDYMYQKHGVNKDKLTYLGDGQHGYVGKCTFPGCKGTTTALGGTCVGGSHDNDGICKECGGQYQYHVRKIIYTNSTSGRHFISYRCSYGGCDALDIEGHTEECYGGTHENGGKCEACGVVYNKHVNTDEIVGYEVISNIYHKCIYKCPNKECSKTFKGGEKAHEIVRFIDNENGTHSDKCIECGYVVTQEHRYENDEPSTFILTRATLRSNGPQCLECGALASAAENGCEHSYIEKSDETQHWEECSKCKYLKQGTLQEHEYSDSTDNGDGTHSGICKICEYKATAEHYYEDGVCTECKAEYSQGCKHIYILKCDEKNHWQQCSECDEIKSETFEEHEFEIRNLDDGAPISICKLCNYRVSEENDDANEEKPNVDNNTNTDNQGSDDTVADKEIPKAGIQAISVMLAIGVGIVLVVTVFKMKKYKDIK